MTTGSIHLSGRRSPVCLPDLTVMGKMGKDWFARLHVVDRTVAIQGPSPWPV